MDGQFGVKIVNFDAEGADLGLRVKFCLEIVHFGTEGADLGARIVKFWG